MRRFYLQRNADASGVSGTGKVAEGCQFDTKWCALVWLTSKSSMCYYPDIETLESIHGHGGMTQVVWVDDESSNVCISSSVMDETTKKWLDDIGAPNCDCHGIKR